MGLKKIFKTKNIITVSPEESLSSAFSRLSSSHDSAFVFEENKFLGIINPYYCLIKTSYPGNSKVKSCLVHPPRIDINFSLEKTAKLMIESKIHYLPVFEGEKFIGIISARRILSAIINLPKFNQPISQILKNKKPLVVIYEDDFISEALSLFKKHRFSKLVVISKDFRLRGILSYFDIVNYLLSPREKPSSGGRNGNKSSYLQKQVKNFMKEKVLTLFSYEPIKKAIKLILEKEIGSVIIVDEENHPIGIITTRDILSYFIKR